MTISPADAAPAGGEKTHVYWYLPVQFRSNDNLSSFSAVTNDFTVSMSPLRAAYSNELSVELFVIFTIIDNCQKHRQTKHNHGHVALYKKHSMSIFDGW